MGSFAVADVNTKWNLVYFSVNPTDPPKAFGLAQVKRYFQAEQAAFLLSTDLENAITSSMSGKHGHDTEPNIFATKLINAKDPRASSNEMKVAERNEFDGLVSRGTFRIVKKRIS